MTPIEEIARFLDVPIEMNVELDRRLLAMREVMAFDVDSIIRQTTTGVRITDFRTEG